MPNPSKQAEPSGADGVPSLASGYVRSLLHRHEIPSMRHVSCVADILGFTYSQVHRRMTGAVAWELEEIAKVAERFGESLATVFQEGASVKRVDAWLLAGAAKIPCLVVLGERVDQARPDALFAARQGSQWIVSSAESVSSGELYAIHDLWIVSKEAEPRRIAILDDDVDEASSLAEFFVDRGCQADAFTSMEALMRQMSARRYDAYVLDWVLREGSSAELVAMIRADDASCPIAILTGKIEGDIRIEMDVAEALATYRLMFFQKPTRLPLITSQLLRALAAH